MHIKIITHLKLNKMKKLPIFSKTLITVFTIAIILTTACTSPPEAEILVVDPVEDNIKVYSLVWDEIVNKGKLDMFNENYFTKDVVMHASPSDIIGIDSARAYYANFITGFSDIQFTIVDIFGQGDKLVKHWNFKGTHTGDFFGIPATGNSVNIDGTTLVRMSNGKIAEERDFMDNLDFLTQLGQIPPME